MASEAKTPQATTPAYKFKKGATNAMHPFLGMLTVDHLKDPRIINAIKRLDVTDKLTWFADNIVAA